MQRLDFNTGWHFSCPDGRDFDVTLPHDAMLNTPRNTEPGFTWFLLAGWRGNDYTYTKNLHITSELINKHLVLEFEGVYCMTTVTVNDRPAAEKAYGYTPFTVELDGFCAKATIQLKSPPMCRRTVIIVGTRAAVFTARCICWWVRTPICNDMAYVSQRCLSHPLACGSR